MQPGFHLPKKWMITIMFLTLGSNDVLKNTHSISALVFINYSRHEVRNFLTITFVLTYGEQSGIDETLCILVLGPDRRKCPQDSGRLFVRPCKA